MKKSIFAKVVLANVLLSLLGGAAIASRVRLAAQTPDKQPIILKIPNGYMPAELSGHAGKLFLDPKKPAGMFVGYPNDGQDISAFSDEVKGIVVKMFMHDAKDVSWTSVALPPHKNFETETGSLMTTSDDRMELQLAFYVRPDTGVAYGYFAMRHKKGASDDGKFLDSSGAGVKAFDELARSIGVKPKS